MRFSVDGSSPDGGRYLQAPTESSARRIKGLRLSILLNSQLQLHSCRVKARVVALLTISPGRTGRRRTAQAVSIGCRCRRCA